MTSGLFIGAYWGSRRDVFSSSPERLARSVETSAGIDSAFFRWFRRGRTRREALRFGVTVTKMPHALRQGRNRRDSDGTIIEEHGFSLGLWNGRADGESAGMSVHVCSAVSVGSNYFTLSIDGGGPLIGRLYRLPLLRDLSKTLVAIWDPDWVVIRPNGLDRRPGTKPRRWGPRTGWLVYLADRCAGGAAPPSGSEAERLGAGQLLTTTQEAFSSDDAAHIARAIHLQDWLDTLSAPPSTSGVPRTLLH